MQLQVYTVIIFLLVFMMGFGQKFGVPDSLIHQDFDELYQKMLTEKDRSKKKLFTKAYLQKAKNLDSISEMARGYHSISYFFTDNPEKQFMYLDSSITLVKNTKHVLQTGVIYMTKGLYTQNRGNYTKALEYYLEGLEYAKKKNTLVYISLFSSKIADLKRKLGKYNEAKPLYKKSIQYEKTQFGKKVNDSIRYLLFLNHLVSTYRLNKEIDSAYYFYNQGEKMAQGSDIKGAYTLNKGILKYHDNDYYNAITLINQGIKEFLNCKWPKTYGYYNLIDGYFFLGKSHNALDQKEIAINYFKKIDSIAKVADYLISESIPAYPEIINYYKSINDKDNQLHYINRLLHNDSIFYSRYKSVIDKLNKEYDTPKLLDEKQKLIASLKKENTKISSQNIIISILLGLSLLGIGYYYYRQRLYKKRFLKLLEEKNNQQSKKEDPDRDPPSSSSINKETVSKLLDKLHQFEEKQTYLKQGLNAKDLAKSFGSNSSYLSKVVNTFKEKSFSNYINDLRIDFVIDQLQKDTRFRKYTVKAIAQEIGFNNSEAFAKAFYKKTGIYPSYFIKELEKR